MCRAKALAQAAGKAGDAHSVPAGTYLEVHVADVPTSAAAAVVQRVSDSLQVCVPPPCPCIGKSGNFRVGMGLPRRPILSCAVYSVSLT